MYIAIFEKRRIYEGIRRPHAIVIGKLYMTNDPTSPGADIAAYAYRPSLLGAPWEFRITAGGLEWEAGRKTGSVALRDIRRIRLSFRPANMQTRRYVTEIWADNAPKLQIVSCSWKSMVVQERLDGPYAAFVRELHARIAQAGVHARLERGSHPLVYWPGLVVFAAVTLGLLALIVRALQAQALGGAAFIGVFCILFLWQSGNFFRRNVPGVYRPDALPATLLPKG